MENYSILNWFYLVIKNVMVHVCSIPSNNGHRRIQSFEMCRVCVRVSVTGVAGNQSATALPVQFNVNLTTIHYLFNAIPHYSQSHSLSLSDALPRAHNNVGTPHSVIK